MSAAAVVIGVFMVINLVIALMVSARRTIAAPRTGAYYTADCGGGCSGG